MPSIELLGYNVAEKTELELALRNDLADLEFCNEIVFVHYISEVSGFDGSNQPYLRVSTRNEAKGKQLLERLKQFADVEFMQTQAIEFKISS